MSTTQELIQAISTGDAMGIETAFNTAMAEKIAVKLDGMRANIAQTMFNAPAPAAEVPAQEVAAQ
jgi:hypothetical protein